MIRQNAAGRSLRQVRYQGSLGLDGRAADAVGDGLGDGDGDGLGVGEGLGLGLGVGDGDGDGLTAP
jgi:hypothetical protein